MMWFHRFRVTQRQYRLLIVILILGLSLLPILASPVQAQGCGMGDLMCEINALLEKTTDFINLEANYALHSTLYQFIHDVAVLLWGFWKALYSVAVGVGWIADWMGANLFQPMIQTTTDMTKSVISIVTFVALVVLGCTYVLSSVIRLRVVNPRNAFLWLLAIGLFFQLAPQLFSGMFAFRNSMNTFMMATATQALNGKNPFAKLSTDDPDKTGLNKMLPPCHNFAAYFPSTAGIALNGLDIGLAYLRADGFDVLSDGSRCSGVPVVATSTDLPRSWYQDNGYFNLLMAPDTWHDGALTTDEKITLMKTAVQMAFASIARLLNDLPIVVFGIMEQFIGLCLVLAIGLVFASFSIAALFAFFERTESIAWAVMDNWLSLIVQMFFIGLLQAMVLALYVSAAKQPNPSPLVTVALAWMGLFIFVMLLQSAMKAVWNAFNRLFEAVGMVTRAKVTPGETLIGGVQVGAAIVSGGATLAGNIGGATAALANGGTWAQAAGMAMGGNRALDGAAWQLTRLPGVRNTMIGEVAEQFVEGSAAARAGQAVMAAIPGGGAIAQLTGASVGTAFLTDRNRQHEQAYLDEHGQVYWQAPPLQNGMNNRVETLTRGPHWDNDASARIGRGGLPIQNTDGTPLSRQSLHQEEAVTTTTLAQVWRPTVRTNDDLLREPARSETSGVSTATTDTALADSLLARSGRYADMLQRRDARFSRGENEESYREQVGDNGEPEFWHLVNRQPLTARQFLMYGEGITPDLDNNREYIRFQRHDGAFERQTWERVEAIPEVIHPVTRATLSAADTDLDEGLQRDVQNAVAANAVVSNGTQQQGSGTDIDGSQRLEQAATQFNAAVSAVGDTLARAAETQLRAATMAANHQASAMTDGALHVDGTNGVAAVMGKTVAALQMENAQTGNLITTPERVSRALTGAVNVMPITDTPVEHRLSPIAAFADRAVTMGLSGTDAQQVLQEIQTDPQGRLSPVTRQTLVQQQHAMGRSWHVSMGNVQALEVAARQLPDQLEIHGAKPVALPSPSDVDVVSTASVDTLRERYRHRLPQDVKHVS
ncbi:MAG: hypothetical protein KF716_25635 [Anaerolineae bacterium]|nr:hypothetical protein [Anaerolineae bacterium]